MSQKIIATTLSAILALSVTNPSIAANVTTKAPHLIKGMEKCYGIAKPGKNDCGTTTQVCGGKSTSAGAKNTWIAVPKGTCNKIVGGSTTEGATS